MNVKPIFMKEYFKSKANLNLCFAFRKTANSYKSAEIKHNTEEIEQNFKKLVIKMANRDRSFSNFVTHRHHLRDILKSKVDHFKMDIIGGLCEMNLSHLCYDIFSQLGSRSFANSRLVSKTWKDFIDYEFDKPKGRKWMREKLQQNYLDNDFCKRVSCAKIHPFLNGISKDRLLIDKDGICVMNDISGEIHMYENDSLNLKWKRNFSSYSALSNTGTCTLEYALFSKS